MVRGLLGLLGASALLSAQSLLLTFDDGPSLGRTPKLNAQERNAAILDALREAKAPAVLMVMGRDGGDSPEGRLALKAWSDAGHALGNHTFSHLNLDKVSAEAFLADVKRCDALIKDLPGFAPWLRFPYLKEGLDPTKRDAVRAGLKAMGYRDLPVTLATFDWFYDERLRERLRKDPVGDVSDLRSAYLEHVLDAADQARELGRRLLGRDPVHVILLHHTLLNALYLGDLLRALKANGWTFVPLDAAARDPLYAMQAVAPNAGADLLWSLAQDRKVDAGPDLDARHQALLAQFPGVPR
jgi:peptidoglycan/xylan/chitin deacetylase (PgdA/CDA1 family)